MFFFGVLCATSSLLMLAALALVLNVEHPWLVGLISILLAAGLRRFHARRLAYLCAVPAMVTIMTFSMRVFIPARTDDLGLYDMLCTTWHVPGFLAGVLTIGLTIVALYSLVLSMIGAYVFGFLVFAPE